MSDRTDNMKELSRQRKWQLKQNEIGLCSECTNPIGISSKVLCESHAIKSRNRSRRYYIPKTKRKGWYGSRKESRRRISRNKMGGPLWIQ